MIMSRLRFLRCFAMACAAAIIFIANEAASQCAAFMLDPLHEIYRPPPPLILGAYFHRIFGIVVDDCLRRAAA